MSTDMFSTVKIVYPSAHVSLDAGTTRRASFNDSKKSSSATTEFGVVMRFLSNNLGKFTHFISERQYILAENCLSVVSGQKVKFSLTDNVISPFLLLVVCEKQYDKFIFERDHKFIDDMNLENMYLQVIVDLDVIYTSVLPIKEFSTLANALEDLCTAIGLKLALIKSYLSLKHLVATDPLEHEKVYLRHIPYLQRIETESRDLCLRHNNSIFQNIALEANCLACLLAVRYSILSGHYAGAILSCVRFSQALTVWSEYSHESSRIAVQWMHNCYCRFKYLIMHVYHHRRCEIMDLCEPFECIDAPDVPDTALIPLLQELSRFVGTKYGRAACVIMTQGIAGRVEYGYVCPDRSCWSDAPTPLDSVLPTTEFSAYHSQQRRRSRSITSYTDFDDTITISARIFVKHVDSAVPSSLTSPPTGHVSSGLFLNLHNVNTAIQSTNSPRRLESCPSIVGESVDRRAPMDWLQDIYPELSNVIAKTYPVIKHSAVPPVPENQEVKLDVSNTMPCTSSIYSKEATLRYDAAGNVTGVFVTCPLLFGRSTLNNENKTAARHFLMCVGLDPVHGALDESFVETSAAIAATLRIDDLFLLVGNGGEV